MYDNCPFLKFLKFSSLFAVLLIVTNYTTTLTNGILIRDLHSGYPTPSYNPYMCRVVLIFKIIIVRSLALTTTIKYMHCFSVGLSQKSHATIILLLVTSVGPQHCLICFITRFATLSHHCQHLVLSQQLPNSSVPSLMFRFPTVANNKLARPYMREMKGRAAQKEENY